MKSILLILFCFVFLPSFAFANDNIITNTENWNQVLSVVRDTEGNPLNKDSRYFILSALWGAGGGGGVRLAKLGDDDQKENTCATAVVQSANDLDKGTPVYFKPKSLKQQEIVQSSSVNIKFDLDYYLCANLTVWKVDNYPKRAKKYTVSTGGKLGNALDVNSWFQIKPVGGSTALGGLIYNLEFCPYGEKFTCQNVGIANENGYRRLVLSDIPKAFVFEHDKLIGMEIQ